MSAHAETASRYDLSSPRFFEDPERTFAEMRAVDPVHFAEELDAWVLTRYEDVSQTLRSPLFSVARNGQVGRSSSPSVAEQLEAVNSVVRQWMPFSDAPRHTRLRGALSKAFQPQSLRSLAPVIQDIVDELLDEADRDGGLEILAGFGEPLAERVTAHLLGLPPQDAALLKRWTVDLFALLGAAHADDSVVTANARGIEAFQDYVSQILGARRRARGDDLISGVLRDGSAEVSEEEIVGLVITLVAGAYETTAHSISNAVFSLLKQPEQLALVRENPDQIGPAVEELLRFCGPALGVQRTAIEQVEMGGRKVRKGARVYCMLHAANHDPQVFSHPEAIDIFRDQARHVGLGLGAHFCLGAWLTRMETQIALLGLVQRFPELRLASDGETEWVANFAIRGLKELHVRTGAARSTAEVPSRTPVTEK